MKITLAELAQRLGAELAGPPELEIAGVVDLSDAREGFAVWAEKRRGLRQAEESPATAIIAPVGTESAKPLLLSKNPRLAFARALCLFFPPRLFPPGVSPDAVVSPTAVLGEGVTIQARAVIEDGVEVGARTVIQAGVFLGLNSRIGNDCRIYPNAVVNENNVIGNRCIIHAGAVIGGDGFGYVPDEEGCFFKIPQVGRVVIEDDVEIGCNTPSTGPPSGRLESVPG